MAVIYNVNSTERENDLRDVDGGEILPVYDMENDRIGIRYCTGF